MSFVQQSMDKLENERPPYVRFETVAVEDRTASIAEGRYVGKEEDYAIITPSGSKDEIPRKVSEWFPHLENACKLGRFRYQWLEYYKSAFKAWKEGQEVPPNGTPLRDWPGLSPGQLKALLGANVRTVEDCAAMNEQAIGYVGMGARALKARAEAYLKASAGPGKVAEENAALRTKVADLEATILDMQQTLNQFKSEQAAAKRPEPADKPAPL